MSDASNVKIKHKMISNTQLQTTSKLLPLCGIPLQRLIPLSEFAPLTKNTDSATHDANFCKALNAIDTTRNST